MKSQTRAFQVSFLIHAIFLFGILGLSSLVAKKNNLMVIDFSLEKPVPPPAQSSPPSAPVRQKVELKKPPPTPQKALVQEERPLVKSETPKPPDNTPTVLHSTSDLTVPIDIPEIKDMEPGRGLERRQSGSTVRPGSTGAAPGSVGGTGTGSSSGKEGTDKARAKYLSEHFAYIREKILRNVSYPPLARRLGWQGKVLVSFIINLNGTIKEAKVMQSSGYELLDKTALETIKESEPFPQPPIEAQIVIPIAYRIN
jgi:periplasmic protein TonB